MDVTPLSDFNIGMTGARDIATLALDGSGIPLVAIQNRSQTIIARFDGTEFATEAFSAGSGVTLRQQTSVAVDGSGRTHVAFWVNSAGQDIVCHGVAN